MSDRGHWDDHTREDLDVVGGVDDLGLDAARCEQQVRDSRVLVRCPSQPDGGETTDRLLFDSGEQRVPSAINARTTRSASSSDPTATAKSASRAGRGSARAEAASPPTSADLAPTPRRAPTASINDRSTEFTSGG
ncbi:MAG: hypothetical protein WKF58_09705 [Ilumatobacteraceae bacterium]